MTDSRKLRVFLCHSSQDKPIVRELYYRLLYEGWIDPWLDEKKLLPGMNWPMEIEIALEKTDVVIVFLSNNSVTKEGYIQKELKKIIDVADEKLESTIFIVPLRLDDCLVPRQLKNRHFENYFPAEARFDAYKRILISLKMRAESEGFDMMKISSLMGLDTAGDDDLLKDAINLAIQNGEVTVSLLQRKLRIGYVKSTSLISEMEKMGLLKMTIDQEQPTWLYKPIGSYYGHQLPQTPCLSLPFFARQTHRP